VDGEEDRSVKVEEDVVAEISDLVGAFVRVVSDEGINGEFGRLTFRRYVGQLFSELY